MPSASPTVLLVEQDIVVRHPLAEYLRECGFKVLEAQSGDQAKLVLNSRDARIDVVLADMTTKGSGFALHHWIKANHPDVDVILAGSLERSVDKAGELCNEGPALKKPYEHRLVLERIRAALGHRGGSR